MQKNNIEFNEDVFMDTIVRCMSTFSKENATNVDVNITFGERLNKTVFHIFPEINLRIVLM